MRDQHCNRKQTLEEVRAGQEYLLKIETVPPLPKGRVVDRALLKLADGKPDIPIGVTSFGIRAFSAMPPQLRLPKGGVGASGMLQKVKITAHGDQPVSVKGARSSLSGVTASVTPVEAGKVFELSIQFPPGFKLPEGAKYGTVSVDTDHPQSPVFNVVVLPALNR